MVSITLHLNPQFIAFAKAMAERQGYFGPADYLTALLNMAVLTAMDEEDWPVEGGAATPAPDLDDGIPF